MDETESNDTFSDADVLSSGTQLTGQLSSSTDWDVFAITAASAGTISVNFDAPTNSSYNGGGHLVFPFAPRADVSRLIKTTTPQGK